MQFVDIHTHRHNVDSEVIAIESRLYGRDYHVAGLYAAGIHPWDADKVSIHSAECWLEQQANAVAIGECGFDFHLGRSNFNQQKKLFELQLDMAQRRGLPVIVPCVRGYNELLNVCKDYSSLRLIVHGFCGSLQLMEQLVAKNFYISIGAMILKNEKLREVLKEIPDEKLLIETDESSIGIRDIYSCVCRVRDLEIDDLKMLIYTNFRLVFNL